MAFAVAAVAAPGEALQEACAEMQELRVVLPERKAEQSPAPARQQTEAAAMAVAVEWLKKSSSG